MKNTYCGINIQYPISQLILSGEKTIETRTYPIPRHHLGVPLLLIETPGKTGKFKSRAIAIITFGRCFKYLSKTSFYAQMHMHKVDRNSPWAWVEGKAKWGWEISRIVKLKKPAKIEKRLGIKFTKDISLSSPPTKPTQSR